MFQFSLMNQYNGNGWSGVTVDCNLYILCYSNYRMLVVFHQNKYELVTPWLQHNTEYIGEHTPWIYVIISIFSRVKVPFC